jgi:hypothetical protein
MKKLIFILLLSILIYTLLTDDTDLEEFTEVESEVNEILTNRLNINTQYEGYCVEYDIAEFTDDIIIASKYETTYYINYFNSNGDKVWGIKIPDKGYSISCSIAENGSSVAITHYSSEFYINRIYSSTGDLLFKNRYKCLKLKPIHNGNLFYDTTNMKQNKRKTMIFFDRDGNDFDLVKYKVIDDNIVRLELIDCNDDLFYTDMELSYFTPLIEALSN